MNDIDRLAKIAIPVLQALLAQSSKVVLSFDGARSNVEWKHDKHLVDYAIRIAQYMDAELTHMQDELDDRETGGQ